MADEASRPNEQTPGQPDDAPTRKLSKVPGAPATPADTPGPATHPRRSERLPLLAFLGHDGADADKPSGGFIGVLLVGAVALVVALMAVTIAIGRAPQNVSVNPQETSTHSLSVAPTTYSSPAQTDTRWTAEPMITGVPQQTQQPTPTATSTSSTSPSDDQPNPGRGAPTDAQSPANAQSDAGRQPPGQSKKQDRDG